MKITIASFFLCIVWLISFSIYAQEIKGKVFHDTNKNCKLDLGEKGISGVMVSNQKDVVLTDQEGNYVLPVEKETVVFVTKPSGYMVPLDENNLPKFYYVYDPKGSPNMEFKGVEPTGPIPESVNFPLFESKESEEFEVVVYGDPQTLNFNDIAFLGEDIISEIASESNAAFCFVLGDITFDNLSLYDKINKTSSFVGMPIYNLPGNHDLNHDVKDNRYAYETFKSKFGPHYYSFDFGKVHFVALANIEWHPQEGEKKPHYIGMLGENQLEWLKNDLRNVDKEKLLILGMHIPCKTKTSDRDSDRVCDKEKLFEIIKDRPNVLIVTGHNHTIEHVFFGPEDGWNGKSPLQQIICAAACGTWWAGLKDERKIPTTDQVDGSPNGYHILKIKGTQVEERFKPAFRSEDFQMRISMPQSKILIKDLENGKIIVNVFDGSERFDVECVVDTLPAEKMLLTFDLDPYFVRLYEENKHTYRKWVHAVPCTHLWQLALPKNLGAGLHKITITAKNHYDKIYKACHIFEVE